MTRRRFTRGRSWQAAGAMGLAACLAATGLVSCDKMPLAAPTDSTITLYASSTTVGLNGAIDITATVIESGGTPVQNGTVVTFTTTLGSIEPTEARTNNGKAVAKLLAGTKSGTAEVRAFSGGISSGDALSVTVGAAAAGKVELLANPSALPASGGVVQLTAVVSDAVGNRLSGIPVTFSADAGVITPSSATSDASGEARSTLSTTAKSRVTASVVGGTSSSLTASVDILVRVGPTVTITTPSASLVPGVPATFSVSVTAGGAAVRSATIDFGDGGKQSVSTSGSSTATHVYTRSGTYIVTAEAIDTAGETTTAMASVAVQGVTVNVTLSWLPANVKANLPVDFTATATTNPTGVAISSYRWSINGTLIATTSGNTLSYIPTAAGTYEVKVRVETVSGASGEALRYVIVNPS